MKTIAMLFSLAGVIIMCGCVNKSARQIKQNSQPGQYAQKLNRQVTLKLDYLLYLPKDYSEQKKLPLLVFLHGAGERGSNINQVKAHGPAKLAEEGKDLPFIVVSPQCPQGKWWPNMTEHIMAVIDEVTENYPVDTHRIYLTGLSMGGFGTWAAAAMYPERFAAIAPICGGGQPYLAANLKEVPVWAFHGAKDSVIPLSMSQQMVDAVNAAGGSARLTIYPDADHNSWTQTYNNDALYEWFLSHSK